MIAPNEIDRRQYTESELNKQIEEGQLPGFRHETPFGKHLFLDKTAIQPVVTFILLQRVDEERWGIVGGIRDEEENAHSHPGVWSPPTWRLTHNEAYDMMADDEDRRMPVIRAQNTALDERHVVKGLGPKKATLVANYEPPAEGLLDESSPLAKVFYERSRDKLLSDPTDERVRPWYSPNHIWSGPTIEGVSGVGDNLLEPIAMFSKIAITNKIIPPGRTKHYHHLGVTPIDVFMKGLEAKDVAAVAPSVREEDDYLLKYCFFGLCNEVAKLALEKHRIHIDRFASGI